MGCGLGVLCRNGQWRREGRGEREGKEEGKSEKVKSEGAGIKREERRRREKRRDEKRTKKEEREEWEERGGAKQRERKREREFISVAVCAKERMKMMLSKFCVPCFLGFAFVEKWDCV